VEAVSSHENLVCAAVTEMLFGGTKGYVIVVFRLEIDGWTVE